MNRVDRQSALAPCLFHDLVAQHRADGARLVFTIGISMFTRSPVFDRVAPLFR